MFYINKEGITKYPFVIDSNETMKLKNYWNNNGIIVVNTGYMIRVFYLFSLK